MIQRKQLKNVNELAAVICGKLEEYRKGSFFASTELQDRYGISIETFINLMFDVLEYVPPMIDVSTVKKYKAIGYFADGKFRPLLYMEVKDSEQV